MMRYVPIVLLLLTSACQGSFLPSQDMQGENPAEYYAKHPVKNTVETRHGLYTVRYERGQDRLSSAGISELHLALSDISPEAVESIRISVSPAQFFNDARRGQLQKSLKAMGYASRHITFVSSREVKGDEAEIDVTYAAVVPPHCPDWRTSPTTTYSNTKQGNIGCATVVNLGRMVADPRDLARGQGRVSPDSERNAVAIRAYRSGQSAGGDSSGGDAAADLAGAAASMGQ